jgi:hypothetical protein
VPLRAGERAVTITNVLPKSVEVFVDKVQQDWMPGAPIRVGPGKHDVMFANDTYCYRKTVTLEPKQQAIDNVRLDWKNATLVLKVTPPGASIVVKHRGSSQEGRDGVPLTITIPRDSEDGTEMVQVSASADGYRPAEVAVRVRAGSSTPQPIKLVPLH